MKVLVACEFSGIVRDAFIKRGHLAVSCDLLPTERYGPHRRGDVLDYIKLTSGYWDLMVAHPPCTHLAVSGARWFPEKIKDGRQREAIDFFMDLVNAPINKICIENPISIMSTKYKLPDQIIHPWMFGHGETKATCLWLKNLPKLTPTDIVKERYPRIHRMAPGPNRSHDRSLTYQGIAQAMAEQWG